MKIELKKVNYYYNKGLANEAHAVKDVDLSIEGSAMIALIGSTGSGKSTMIQMFNGLLEPTSGQILFDDVMILGAPVGDVLLETDASSGGQKMRREDQGRISKRQKKEQQKAEALDKKLAIRNLRKKVGLVFQYPENQLFDETVLKDAAFGPKNQGYSPDEANAKAERALLSVGIKKELFEKSPFELSGGEMRRVAIAGVLAMEPEVLILDEPTAGLDPQGKIEILDCIKRLQRSGSSVQPPASQDADRKPVIAEKQLQDLTEESEIPDDHKEEKTLTVIFVSHNMEEVAEYADRVIAMAKGRIVFDGPVRDVFRNHEALEKIGLKAPEVTYLCEELGLPGMIKMDEAAAAILQKIRR